MQRIATRGAAAAEAFAHGGHHFLAVASAADPAHGVLVLEWQRGRGMYVEFTKLAVTGVAELGSCLLPSGRVLLGLATWHAGGSFTGESHLYDFDPARTPPLELRQSLPTHGAHDLECFTLAEGLRVLHERWGIPAERVVAVGDATNDVPMLAAAGLGVAMGNSFPGTRSAADRVIGDNDTDAIGLLVEELFLVS